MIQKLQPQPPAICHPLAALMGQVEGSGAIKLVGPSSPQPSGRAALEAVSKQVCACGLCVSPGPGRPRWGPVHQGPRPELH